MGALLSTALAFLIISSGNVCECPRLQFTTGIFYQRIRGKYFTNTGRRLRLESSRREPCSRTVFCGYELGSGCMVAHKFIRWCSSPRTHNRRLQAIVRAWLDLKTQHHRLNFENWLLQSGYGNLVGKQECDYAEGRGEQHAECLVNAMANFIEAFVKQALESTLKCPLVIEL